MKPDFPFKTLAVITVLLLAAGAIAGRMVVAADQAAKQAHTFIGTPPAAGATEGNPPDHTY